MGHDLNAGVPPDRPQLVRKSERALVNADVSLRRSGHNKYQVRAYDVSCFGCKLEFVERPELDERVWVKFDGLEGIEGLVCWSEGFVVGIEFVRPIYAPVFDALVPRLR
jgi:hypothetical protein